MRDAIAPHDDDTHGRGEDSSLVSALADQLPHPPEETQDQRRKRIGAAIAAIDGLSPATLAEAQLALRHVVADDHAGECQRQTNQFPHDPAMQARYRAQSAAMSRMSDSALRSLLQLQAARKKRDANPEAARAATLAQHRALSAMYEALRADKGGDGF